jgi:hypothetical protein
LQEWSVIQQQLELLEKEELVVTEQQNTLVIRITTAGLEKVKAGNNLIPEESED